MRAFVIALFLALGAAYEPFIRMDVRADVRHRAAMVHHQGPDISAALHKAHDDVLSRVLARLPCWRDAVARDHRIGPVSGDMRSQKWCQNDSASLAGKTPDVHIIHPQRLSGTKEVRKR